MDKNAQNILRKIIEIYANIPPKPIENLREIEAIILSLDQDKENTFPISQCIPDPYFVIHTHIETIFRLHEIGIYEARRIYDDDDGKDAFMESIISSFVSTQDADLHKESKNRREIYDQAFNDLYGWCIPPYPCPCSYERAEILKQEGLISYDGDLREAEWTNGNERGCISCMECDHLRFVTILRGISNREYHLLEPIAEGYRRTMEEQVVCGSKRQPLAKIHLEFAYGDNPSAFPGYLNGLPCNALIDLLASDPKEAGRIKQCPHCMRFFFARDAKRKICYDNPACRNEYHRNDMKLRRKTDPVRYC